MSDRGIQESDKDMITFIKSRSKEIHLFSNTFLSAGTAVSWHSEILVTEESS